MTAIEVAECCCCCCHNTADQHRRTTASSEVILRGRMPSIEYPPYHRSLSELSVVSQFVSTTSSTSSSSIPQHFSAPIIVRNRKNTQKDHFCLNHTEQQKDNSHMYTDIRSIHRVMSFITSEQSQHHNDTSNSSSRVTCQMDSTLLEECQCLHSSSRQTNTLSLMATAPYITSLSQSDSLSLPYTAAQASHQTRSTVVGKRQTQKQRQHQPSASMCASRPEQVLFTETNTGSHEQQRNEWRLPKQRSSSTMHFGSNNNNNYYMTISSLSWCAKLFDTVGHLCHRILLLMAVLLLCSSHFLPCDTQTIPFSYYYAHHRFPRLTESNSSSSTSSSVFGELAKVNRTFTLGELNQMNRHIRQPIHQSQFCDVPPLVPNAQSHLHRNQKHYVFPMGTVASYMCDQGYKAVDGVAETRCTFVTPELESQTKISTGTVSGANQVIFPDSHLKSFDPISAIDSDPHQVVLLGSGRSKNSKRLISDLDEEPDVNGSGHRSVIFPGHYATGNDKKKMSRKTDTDDLIGSMYDTTGSVLDGRHSDLDNDNVDFLEKRKQKIEKNVRNLSPRWWPPVTLNCQLVNCSDPGQVEHAQRRDPPLGIMSFNSNVQYVCEEGYETIGIPILTCRANGSWNRPPPKCRLKQCPPLPSLENGRILYNNERRTDSRAEYHCDEGFRLNAHSTVRLCRQDDTWSQLEPLLFVPNATNSSINDPYRCIPIECPAPVRPHAGLRILNLGRKRKFLPGDMIIYACDVIKTKATAKCRPDGEWSRGVPHCPELTLRCPALPHFPHGVMSVNGEQNKATFICFDGYQLDGPSSITCLQRGVWSGSVPRCVQHLPMVLSSNTGNLNHTDFQTDNNTGTSYENLEQQTSSKTLTILLSVIGVVLCLVVLAGMALFCRWRQKIAARKRWQVYFGLYHHRQSKTNIVLSNTYGNNLNGAAGHSTGLSSVGGNNVGLNAASRHLLQRQRTDSNGAARMGGGNFLQSSFSSSDDNAAEVKSFTTGTISSEQARTVSSYAEDTCAEDEFDEEEEEDEDLYSDATILQETNINSRQPVPSARRINVDIAAEATPMILLTPTPPIIARTTTNPSAQPLNFGPDRHLYSNTSTAIGNLRPRSSSPATATFQQQPSRFKQQNPVPVTDL